MSTLDWSSPILTWSQLTGKHNCKYRMEKNGNGRDLSYVIGSL